MKRIPRALLPGFLVRPLRVYRKHLAAQRTHREMEAIGQELRPELASGTQIIPERFLAHLPAHGVVAEIGVAEGDRAQLILERAEPVKLFLVDLWAGRSGSLAKRKVEDRFRTEIAAGRVELRQECSWLALESFPDEFFDWVYIDASHDYRSVKKDLEAARRKVKPAGLICGHDYVLWSEDGLSRFGVVEAVNEFCNTHNYSLKYLSNQRNRHLSYALLKRTT